MHQHLDLDSVLDFAENNLNWRVTPAKWELGLVTGNYNTAARIHVGGGGGGTCNMSENSKNNNCNSLCSYN